MATYVNDSGTWREINNLYVHDGTSFTNKTIDNVYINDSGTWREVFTLFTTTAYSTSTGSIVVPAGANAIHVQYAVGGGGGGFQGADYDKAGGESAGSGGASGAYISDKVFSITGGETLTIAAGAAGAADTSGNRYSGSSSSGATTSVVGGITGSLFTLGGGGGASAAGGGVQGPLRSNTAGTGGTATISTSLSSGTTTDGINITSLNGGPTGTFNQGGAGGDGTTNGNCSGDNCSIAGSTGGASYNGNVAGGGASTAGTRGSGGGGGNHPLSGGGAGGAGEINYRFMRIT